MTMKANWPEIPAGQFKARCLALLDRVQRTGESVIVTKHGKPVASINPVTTRVRRPLRGSGQILGDIMAPLGEPWEMDR